MNQNFLNNIFLYDHIEVPRELYSHSSSEYEIENQINYLNGPMNFYDRNTNEMTFDEQNNNGENRRDELVVDISQNSQNNSTERKLLGRKKLGDTQINSNHTKYSDDNSRRKIKRIIITELQDFINYKIEYFYGYDIGEGLLKKKLMKLGQAQISDASIEFNIKFLKKTLKDIFSEDVTGRITNYPSDRNRQIVQELMNDKDEVKSNYFCGLFNLIFLDCLKYFRGDDVDIPYLNGFKKFSEIKDKFENKSDKNYVEHISKYLNDYENILFKKKPRKCKKGKKKICDW